MPARNRAPKAELTASEVPPGAKQITRTTTERFNQPISDDSDLKKPTLEVDDGTDEESNGETEFILDDEEPKSPLDSVLASLKGIGEITIYVIRKPDPMGLTFVNPCNMAHTAGDLPFDESFRSKEAIELAVQSVYGGGKYQLQIRQNGDYMSAWTTLIADPRKRVEPNPPAPQYIPQPVQQEPQRSAREELREVLELAKDIAEIRGGNQQPEHRPLPPADPFKVAEASLNMLEKAQTLFGNRSDSAPVAAGGEHHWTEGLLNGFARLFDSRGVATLVEKGSALITSAFAKAQAEAEAQARREAAMQAAANGNNAEAYADRPQNNSSQSPTALPAGPVAVGSGGEASAPAAQAVPSAAANPAPEPAGAEVNAEEMAVLEIVVAEIRGYESDEDTDALEGRVEKAVAAVRTLPAETVALLNGVPTAYLLPYLITVNPAWADLAQMTDAGAFIGLLVENLREAPEEKGSGEVVQFPPLAAVETAEGEAVDGDKNETSEPGPHSEASVGSQP